MKEIIEKMKRRKEARKRIDKVTKQVVEDTKNFIGIYKQKKKSKKTEERELDDMWKHKVKDRDNWECQICKKKVEKNNCHAHHILPRQIKGMKWDVNNGITLCYNHHKVGVYSPHQNVLWFYGWLNENKSIQLKYCLQKLIEYGRKNV